MFLKWTKKDKKIQLLKNDLNKLCWQISLCNCLDIKCVIVSDYKVELIFLQSQGRNFLV